MEKEIKIKATLVLEAVDQNGKPVVIRVNQVTVNEIIFDKVTIEG